MANYAEVVDGSHISGTIYNGTLGDQPVIVKKIRKQQKCSEQQLKQLLNLNCENVVKYLACSSESSEYAWWVKTVLWSISDKLKIISHGDWLADSVNEHFALLQL